jgi:hypothetical protein
MIEQWVAACEGGVTWRDLWIVRLDEQRRCTSFEEWPWSATCTRQKPPNAPRPSG